MDILNPTALKSLIAQQGKWCVSLYMPTHRAGREQQQDPIRLKNLLAQAETKLLANGLRRPEIQKLMQPAEELLWNKDFCTLNCGDNSKVVYTNLFYKGGDRVYYHQAGNVFQEEKYHSGHHCHFLRVYFWP